MRICLSWKEFYSVMMEQNRRFGCECLVWVFYYEDTMDDICYGGYYLTYESLESRVRKIRERGYKVIPITAEAKIEHLDVIRAFIDFYLVNREIRRVRYPRRGDEFMVEFEPNCGTIDDFNNHFVEVMLQIL